jgi:hypothetical protein
MSAVNKYNIEHFVNVAQVFNANNSKVVLIIGKSKRDGYYDAIVSHDETVMCGPGEVDSIKTGENVIKILKSVLERTERELKAEKERRGN